MLWKLLFIFSIFYVIYRLIKYLIIDPWKIHRHLAAQGIPGRFIPIFGEILDVRRAVLAEDPFSNNVRLTKQYGTYFRASFGPVARLVTSDPMLIQSVLKTNARYYHKSSLMRLVLGTLLGCDNLLLAEDPIHNQHRRLIAPVFQHQNLNSMISLMNQITLTLLRQWQMKFNQAKEKGEELRLDIQDEMARLTLDIVTACVFGSGLMKNDDVRSVIYTNVTTTLDDVQKRILNLIAIIPLLNQLPLPSKRRIDQSKSDVKRVIQQIIDDRRKGLTKSACKGPDLLDLILAAHGEDKSSQFTDEEIYQEALTFVIAGHETTSNLMIWTLYNLSLNPEIYRELEKEIDAVLTDDDDDDDDSDEEKNEITLAKLSLLNYTECVLKESLRLHQPVPYLVRTVIDDHTLTASDGKKIEMKKGTDVMIDLFSLHHSEKHWTNPFDFDPSRFSQRQMDIYLPFAAGPRSCIGQNFAMLEAKIMLAMMIKRFHFELVPGQKHVPEIVVTMRPKYGMWMKVIPR